MRVLIAEDDPASLLLLRRSVEALGHEVIATTDGVEALAAFEAHAPSVVVSDWMMPGMDGIHLCREIRQRHGSGYVYFMLVTALADKQSAIAGMEAGADDFLTKPVDRELLRVRLAVAERVTAAYAKVAQQQRELEALNARLHEQGRTDALTQLGNRLRLNEDLIRLPAQVERYGYAYSVALADVDVFKQYNDHCGHLAGDQVLARVAAALAANGRSGDGAYRYGGEEFLLLLPGQTLDGAAAAADRHRRAVEELAIPHPTSPIGIVTLSIGVASLTRDAMKDIDTLLQEADSALYMAKHAGRNRVMRFVKA